MSEKTAMKKDSFDFAPLQDYVGNLGNIPDSSKTENSVPPIRIAVLTNRFVYIGRCEIRNDERGQPQWLIMSETHNLRNWGAEKGLGELTQGPTKQTVYDKVGVIYVPYGQVVHIIDVRQDVWKLS